MNINRNNYEELLLLYADNELSFTERQAVENFLEENPDLKTEFQLLLGSKLHSEHIPFYNKSLLYKSDSIITADNYETYFLMYADNELTEDEKRETEKYAAASPALQKEFDLIQQTKLVADDTVVFSDKSVLYKKEVPARVIPIAIGINWMRFAAAAVIIGIILLAGVLLLNKKPTETVTPVAKKESPSNKNITQPKDTPVNNQQPAAENNIAAVNNKKDEAAKKEKNIPQQPQQNIAAVNSSVKENKKQKLPVTNQIVPPSDFVKHDDSKGLKKIEQSSSIKINSTEQEIIVKADAPKEIKTKPVEIVDIAVGPEKINENIRTASYKEEDDKTSVGVFSVNEDKVQKSGLRGFFRKVKRLVDRRGNNNEEKDKKIYIGSFAIALAK